jgi:hypothetical protein
MATFRKYAFPNEATFTALPVPQGFAVPLGEINNIYNKQKVPIYGIL